MKHERTNRPSVKERQLLVTRDSVGERVDGHVGTAPRTVDGEESQTDGRRAQLVAAVRAAVEVDDRLAGFLGRRVHVARRAGGVPRAHADVVRRRRRPRDAERDRRLATVDARAGRVHQLRRLSISPLVQSVPEETAAVEFQL